ncbi:MAG TPA: sensor histidine kinase [Acidimicrobiales bacterium]|jgi:signal transduction histidine kinase
MTWWRRGRGGRPHEDAEEQRPTSVFDDRVPVSRLVLRYAATSLVTLIVVAVVTAYVSRRLGTLEAIDDADRVANLTAGAAVEPVLDDGILIRSPSSIARVDRAVRDQVLRGSLVRVKIWDRDGTILYSDESRLIGQRFELAEEELEVLAGGESQAEISDLSEPENRYEEPATKLLEVYLPVHTPDGTPLLFEAYFRYNGVAEAGRRAWLRFAPITLGALVLLTLLQVPSAVSLARRLRRTQQQREDLLRSAIEATDAERRRIATDLHDGVVQDLAGVTFSLAAAAKEAEQTGNDGRQVREASDRVRDSVRSLRSLLVEIYPPNLYEEGLEAALGDLTAKLEQRGIETSLVVQAPVDKLGLDATRLIYRAAQEALRNVVAHARASRVDVSVTSADGTAVLEVSDDGQGLDTGRIPVKEGHFGLRALAGLAATMGASLSIDSTPGKGTTLCLEVPIR